MSSARIAGLSHEQALRRLALQYKTTRVLAQSATLADAAPRIIEGICSTLDWPYGAFWVLDDRAGVLRCDVTWSRDGAFPAFTALSRRTAFEPGKGLPGRVLERGEPAWIPDVTADGNFPRAPAAAKESLRGAFGFPVRVDGDIVGVFEFFSPVVEPPDEDLLHLVGAIGLQVGQFIERVRGQELIRHSEARKAAALEAALDAIVTIDDRMRVLEWNPAAETIFGYAAAEAIGRDVGVLIVPPYLRAQHRAGVARYLATGKGNVIGRRVELPAVRKSGETFPVEIAILPTTVEGKITFTAYLRDITQRRRAEALQKRVDFLYRATSTMLSESLTLESRLDAVARAAVPDLADACTVTLGDEGAAVVEPRSLKLPLRASGRSIGAIAFTVGEGRAFVADDVRAAEDFAARAAVALENARLYREAQEAIRLREDFIAMASHDLKTPLTSLSLGLQALRRTADREGRLPDDGPERIAKAERQCQRVVRLLDEMLDASRIAAGRLTLERTEVDLGALAREVAERFSEDAEAAGSTIAVRAPAEPLPRRVDRTRMEQVLANLLSNALKYAPGTAVEAAIEAAEDGGTLLAVTDAGPGIPAADRARLFRRFERAGAVGSGKAGTGLGLWIVREIVGAHGGSVAVESEGVPGKGTRFVVRLPAGTP